jgi:hypothetical protein
VQREIDKKYQISDVALKRRRIEFRAQPQGSGGHAAQKGVFFESGGQKKGLGFGVDEVQGLGLGAHTQGVGQLPDRDGQGAYIQDAVPDFRAVHGENEPPKVPVGHVYGVF